MDKKIFEDLKESIKEAVAIVKGEKAPARRTVFSPEEVALIRSGRREEVKAVRLAAIKNQAAVGPMDIKAMRQKLDLSQGEFARLIQVNVRTLQNWEHGHRHPTGPARALLKIVAARPDAALDALGNE
jgi:DNA-binding transcriptional regulator YiaG